MRDLNRKLIDANGNAWCLAIPAADVDADNVVEVLNAVHDGIVRLLGYKLAGDEGYRLPSDNTIIQNPKSFSFFKKITVEGVEQADFAEAMTVLLNKAKESKIGRPKVTTWENSPVLWDDRGPYIEAQIPCHICHTTIKGIKRISQSEGIFTRSQMMQALDKGVVQYRPGSKLRVCSACAPKHLSPEAAGLPFPTVQEVKEAEKIEEQKAAAVLQKEANKVVIKEKDFTDELLALLDPKSTVDPLFIKGAMFWYLKSQRK